MKPILLFFLLISLVSKTGFSQSSIVGKIYNDINNNLLYDTGEELPGIKVWLFEYSSVAPYYRVQPIIEVFTDGSGDYSFAGLAAGNYQVRVGVSSLPATLCRAVADNDSYPNGLTDLNGVNGTSAYTQVNFGFASNLSTPSFSSARTFKWNTTNTFAGGQLSNSFNLTPEMCNILTYNPVITWTTSKSCAPGVANGFGSEQFPQAGTNGLFGNNWPGNSKGGIDPSDTTFQIDMGGNICYNPVNNDRQTTTISFDNPVKNVKFSIYDIDHADPQRFSGRIDHVTITGYLGSIPVMPVIINPSAAPWNTISGNTVTGFIDYPITTYTAAYNSGNADHATVNVYFQTTITSIVVDYEEYSPFLLLGKGILDGTPPVSANNESFWGNRLPTVRGIGIGSIGYTFDCQYILPLTLLSYNVSENNCFPVLKWSVANSVNFKQFEVERSSDGYVFKPIATIPQQTYNTQYQFTDQLPINGNNYYRLRFRDNDGRNSMGPVAYLNLSCRQQKMISINPNPVTGKSMEMYIQGYNKGNYTIQLFNVNMQKVYLSPVSVSEQGIGHAVVPATWASGIYFLALKDYQGITGKMQKIVIQ